MKGEIVIYTGPMFSGKTTALLIEIELAEISGRIRGSPGSIAIKPSVDTRYSSFVFDESTGLYKGRIDAHNKNYFECWGARTFEDIYNIYRKLRERNGKIEQIGIDEVNLFGGDPKTALEIFEYFAYREGVRVIASGLDTNYRGEPFSPIPELMSIADKVEKRTAVCKKCGSRDATRTQRLTLAGFENHKPIYLPSHYDEETIIVGGGLDEDAVRNILKDESRINLPLHIYEPRCVNCHEVPGKPRRYW